MTNYYTIIKPSNETLFRVVKSTYQASLDIFGKRRDYYFTSRKQAEAVVKRLNLELALPTCENICCDICRIRRELHGE